jgi:hypothetical protein
VKRLTILLAVLAAACSGNRGAGGPGRSDPYVGSGVAEVDGFICARNEVRGMGYRVLSTENGDYLLAEKDFRMRSNDNGWSTGYITVTVVKDQPEVGKDMLKVHGERMAVEQRALRPGRSQPPGVLGDPAPGPQPYDTVWTARKRRPTDSRRRVDPGPVAADARRLVDRCTVSSSSAE